jgi:predicted transcriptional regulator
MTNRDQVTVVLPAELREYVRRLAEQEDRSMASVVRRLVAASEDLENGTVIAPTCSKFKSAGVQSSSSS